MAALFDSSSRGHPPALSPKVPFPFEHTDYSTSTVSFQLRKSGTNLLLHPVVYRLSMKPVDKKPFLVPSGEQRISNSANRYVDGTPVSKRTSTARWTSVRDSTESKRDSTARRISAYDSAVFRRAPTARPTFVRDSTAESLRAIVRKLSMRAARSRSPSGTEVAGAVGVGVVPGESGGLRKASAVGAAGGRHNSVFTIEESVGVVAANIPTTTASIAANDIGANANNRSAMRGILHQSQPQGRLQQPVKPGGKNHSIQAERQKRRNRGFHLG